jgi:hypothetical protein
LSIHVFGGVATEMSPSPGLPIDSSGSIALSDSSMERSPSTSAVSDLDSGPCEADHGVTSDAGVPSSLSLSHCDSYGRHFLLSIAFGMGAV